METTAEIQKYHLYIVLPGHWFQGFLNSPFAIIRVFTSANKPLTRYQNILKEKKKLTSIETHIPKVRPQAFVRPATILKYELSKHPIRYHREEILCSQLSQNGHRLRVLEGFCLMFATKVLFLLVD